MRYWQLLSPLDWARLPERDLETDWGKPAVPFAAFLAACLVKLDQQLVYMAHLHQYLCDHPALVWVLGFPVQSTSRKPCDWDVAASLPTPRHFTRLLHTMPNTVSQYLLDETVRLLQAELAAEVDDFGQCVSLDTKHILAWVRENNPKDYVEDRYDKTRQPAGDPDCRLGCKRRRNQRASSKEPPPTPPDNPVAALTISVGEYYWGYGSGVVATKVPGWGEFVLAELTLPFDQPDVAYFHPLLAETERRLGFRPLQAAFDAAFDAFYVYGIGTGGVAPAALARAEGGHQFGHGAGRLQGAGGAGGLLGRWLGAEAEHSLEEGPADGRPLVLAEGEGGAHLSRETEASGGLWTGIPLDVTDQDVRALRRESTRRFHDRV